MTASAAAGARARRYELRTIAQTVTANTRLRGCGRRMIGGVVQLRVGQHGASWSGLAYCGSVWSCPACAAVIRQERAVEVQTGAERHVAAGGGGLWVTATIPHSVSDTLRSSSSIVTKGWRWVWSGRESQDWRLRLGLDGQIRAFEVTVGVNGWHPHMHSLLLTAGDVPEDVREAFRAWFLARWSAWCDRQGWGAPSEAFGVRVQTIVGRDGARNLAAYVTKVQDGAGDSRVLGQEVARADLKRRRGRKGWAPFELLERLHALSEMASLSRDEARERRRLVVLWREYEDAMRGLSSVRWSRGLRDRLGLAPARADAVVAADQAGPVHCDGLIGPQLAYTEATLTGAQWRAVWKIPGLPARVLQVAESGDLERALLLVEAAYRTDLETFAAAALWDEDDGRSPPGVEAWWIAPPEDVDGQAFDGAREFDASSFRPPGWLGPRSALRFAAFSPGLGEFSTPVGAAA